MNVKKNNISGKLSNIKKIEEISAAIRRFSAPLGRLIVNKKTPNKKNRKQKINGNMICENHWFL
jgi:hypothetical protein